MSDPAAALEATALAQFLKQSRWVYPLVNAGHILGLGILIGAVLPMDVAALRRRAMPALRPYAVAGLVLAVLCGSLLFVTQAGDYAANGWFRTKMALLALALLNAGLHVTGTAPARVTAILSLALWPAVLVCGRMIGFS